MVSKARETGHEGAETEECNIGARKGESKRRGKSSYDCPEIVALSDGVDNGNDGIASGNRNCTTRKEAVLNINH